MKTPTFTSCDALRRYLNARARKAYQAAGCPPDFDFDIKSVDPSDDDPYTAVIVARAGKETFAARLMVLGELNIDSAIH